MRHLTGFWKLSDDPIRPAYTFHFIGFLFGRKPGRCWLCCEEYQLTGLAGLCDRRRVWHHRRARRHPQLRRHIPVRLPDLDPAPAVHRINTCPQFPRTPHSKTKAAWKWLRERALEIRENWRWYGFFARLLLERVSSFPDQYASRWLLFNWRQQKPTLAYRKIAYRYHIG